MGKGPWLGGGAKLDALHHADARRADGHPDQPGEHAAQARVVVRRRFEPSAWAIF